MKNQLRKAKIDVMGTLKEFTFSRLPFLIFVLSIRPCSFPPFSDFTFPCCFSIKFVKLVYTSRFRTIAITYEVRFKLKHLFNIKIQRSLQSQFCHNNIFTDSQNFSDSKSKYAREHSGLQLVIQYYLTTKTPTTNQTVP